MSGKRDHGGGLDAAARAFGIPAVKWLDLSTGINPDPYPLPDLPAERWARLPDHDLLHQLRQSAAHCYGAPHQRCIVPAPGSQSLIQWLPRLVEPARRVAVVGPTYNEHAAAWQAAGHEVETPTRLPARADGFSAVVVVRPNNPDGKVLDGGALRDLARHGTRVIVDEAFADVTPDDSLAGAVEDGDLIVLRSFGKFFGLAGLRLGFAIAARETANTLAEAVGPWAVSGPAAEIACAALNDKAWIERTRAHLVSTAERTRRALAENGLELVGGTDLFTLARSEHAPRLVEHLARHAILVRAFPYQRRWIRFGHPDGEEDFSRFAKVLSSFR